MLCDDCIDPCDHRCGTHAERDLLVQNNDLACARRIVEGCDQGVSGRICKDVEPAEIQATAFRLARERLRIHQRLPGVITDHAGVDQRASRAQQEHQLRAKGIHAHDANRVHLSDAKIDQVRNDIAGSAEAIALPPDSLHRQSGLDREFNPAGIELPVRIEAKIPEHRNRQIRQRCQSFGQPRRIIMSHATCLASARNAGRVIGSLAEFAAVGCEAKRAITSSAPGAM